MIITELSRPLMAEKVIVNARIRVQRTDVVANVCEIFDYIDYFNSLPEYTYYVFDRHINDIPILDEFKDYIIPDSVRLHPTDIKTKDLVVRSTQSSEAKVRDFTYAGWINALSDFRRVRKLDINSNYVSLGSLRTPKSLSDVETISCFKTGKKMKLSYQDAPYVPLEIDASVGSALFRDDYFNLDDVRIILMDYYANLRF